MTDVNEQSFSAGTTTEKVTGRGRTMRSRIATPIWRFRPAPVAVVHTIKTQIIPKIVMALRSLPAQKPPQAAVVVDDSVTAFVAMTLADDEMPALTHVESLHAAGVSAETIFLDVLAPTARRLGEMWEFDQTDFAQVTLGLGRLQRLMRELDQRFFNEGERGDPGASALLTTIPGDQHSFGLSMVAEFFRRDGWNLCTGPFDSDRELTSLVQHHWFDVVGFSVSSDRRLDALRADIDAIRRESRNRHVGIMVGGPLITFHPDLVSALGADMLSSDAAAAPQQARGLMAQMSRG